MANTEKYVLLTGSDLGNREEILGEALKQIDQKCGSVIKASTIQASEPWGFQSDTTFLNQAILIETELTADQLLEAILRIEEKLGRTRNSKQWASRLIDIDILCSENGVINSSRLRVPHKHLNERLFALKPLNELVDWSHPVLGKSYSELETELQIQTQTL